MQKVKKSRRRKIWRFWPIWLLVFILGCNSVSTGMMKTSKKKLADSFQKANISGYHFQQEDDLFFTEVHQADSAGALVIFIHGTPGALSNSMVYLTDSILAERFTLVAYDRPGFGLSPGKKEAVSNLTTQAEAIKRLLDRYPDYEQVYLVGHSYGAPVALQVAIEYGQRISGMVWVGGVVEKIWKESAWWRKPIRKAPLKWLVPKPMVISNEEIVNLPSDLADIDDKWDQVQCPVIIIQGEKDWLATPSNAHYAEAKLSNADKQMIPDKSHFFYFSDPTLVRNALLTLDQKLQD